MKRAELEPFIRSAVRLVLDSITYSNALPEWTDEPFFDYSEREAAISRRISAYLSGSAKPAPPAHILVPRKNGSPKNWSIPSVNDQIVLQVCAGALARQAEAAALVDYSHVFSYEPNRRPERLAFTESQFTAWSTFNKEVAVRAKRGAILQLDIEQMYRSVDPANFVAFFEKRFGPGAEIDLLKVLLRSFSAPGEGLPLINESIFYLGDVYLSIVDDLFRKHSLDYVRFVDDYRVFDSSRERLEQNLEEVTRDLASVGFRPNARKTRLGSDSEYFDAIADADPKKEDQYISAIRFDDMPDPAILATMVVRATGDETRITEGMGRFTMQSVRKLKAHDALAKGREGILLNDPVDDRKLRTYLDHYNAVLKASLKPESVARAFDHYSKTGDEWRIVWLLFTTKGAGIDWKATDVSSLPPIARLWARSLIVKPNDVPDEELHTLSYLEAGNRLYGSAA
ncbi:MAG TPA: hypothetical protein VLC46_10575 [Thermoanaerobaculia bacterium]|jgi:hypothetical protein|nr:hypothetical protein [Thermoanaerobaculia bacterium]